MSDYKAIASKMFISHYGRERPIDWVKEFGSVRPLQLEIGFGHGEYLLSCIEKDQDKNYVGIERDWGRIRKCFKRAARMPGGEKGVVENQARIFQIDVWVALERFFAPKTIAGAVCLFPCPWPKDCHEKHRLFSCDFLCLLNSRLKDGAQLQCVTDDRSYADWILAQNNGTGFRIQEKRVPARFGTKFERKWLSGGQQEFYEIIFCKETHVDVPLKEDVALKAFYHQDFFPEKFKIKQEVSDGMAVIPKEWIFDAVQQKGMVRLVVSEEHLTQHMWVGIIKTQHGWCVLRAEGQNILPTQGTARAIELVSAAVQMTSHKQTDRK